MAPDGNPAAPASPTAATSSPMNAPGFGDLFEASLRGSLEPWWVYASLRDRPPPGPIASVACVLAWTATAFGANLLLAMTGGAPAPAGAITPQALAAAAAVGLAASAVGSLVAAVVLHLLALLCGGHAPFSRALQTIALLGPIAPLTAVAAAFPAAWPLPTAAAGWLAIQAVWRLYGAPGYQAAMVLGFVTALSLVGQNMARQRLERWAPMLETLRTAGGTPGAGAIPGIPAAAQALFAVPGGRAGGPSADELRQLQDLAAQGQQLALQGRQLIEHAARMQGAPGQGMSGGVPGSVGGGPVPSGLDLVGTPGAGSSGKGFPAGGLPPGMSPQALAQGGQAMLGSVLQLLGNPALTKNMPPHQAKAMEQLRRSMEGMQLGKGLTDADTRKLAQAMQQFMGSMGMPAGMALPAGMGQAGGSPGGRRQEPRRGRGRVGAGSGPATDSR